MRRLLIVGCSATKDPAEELLPALKRYRGAYYQIINQVPAEGLPEVVILSAELGFISGRMEIPDYNRRMDKRRAEELLAGRVGLPLGRVLECEKYDEVFVAAGSLYRGVIDASLDLLEDWSLVTFARRGQAAGGIGYQRRDLKKWLLGV